jgi:hypothetical protein
MPPVVSVRGVGTASTRFSAVMVVAAAVLKRSVVTCVSASSVVSPAVMSVLLSATKPVGVLGW